MALEQAELSSLAATIEQLARRAGSLGEAARGDKQETVANELFAVERALDGARRRLTRLHEKGR